MPDLDLVTVATFLLRHEAEIAKARLVVEGIPAVVQADDEGGLNPGFFAEYGVRLVVRREQLADARSVLSGDDAADEDGLLLDAEHVEAMTAHAWFSSPLEACGLLAFDGSGRVRFVYSLTNGDQSEHRFTVDPVEQFRAIEHAERNGWEVGGAFHSHPRGGAVPSATDIDSAGTSSWVHVIVGLGSGAGPQLRAYTIRDGTAEEVAVTIGQRRLP